VDLGGCRVAEEVTVEESRRETIVETVAGPVLRWESEHVCTVELEVLSLWYEPCWARVRVEFSCGEWLVVWTDGRDDSGEPARLAAVTEEAAKELAVQAVSRSKRRAWEATRASDDSC
jgi:hypothetical protein